MNRRSFVHTLGAGAFGMAALDRTGAIAAARQTATWAGRSDTSGLIRIGSNENPYGPAASVLDAVHTAALEGNRYPGPLRQTLIQTIAIKHGVPVECVLLSGGSGDILRACVSGFTGKMKALVTGSPSYEGPMRTAQHVGAPVREVALDSALRLDLPAMATRAVGAGLVYVCNPNNPSSTAVAAQDVEALVERVVKTTP